MSQNSYQFIFILLLLCKIGEIVNAQCANTKDNAVVGEFVNGYCLCESGYFPITITDCEGGNNQICTFPTVSPLVSTTVAEFIEDDKKSFVSLNQVNIQIASDFMQRRIMKQITFNTDVPDCVYPGVNFHKILDESSCQDVFTASIPIPTLVNTCKFSLVQTASTAYYQGVIQAQVEDHISQFRGNDFHRVTKSQLRIEISLPKTITLQTTNLQAFGFPDVQYAITKQNFRIDGGSSIEVTTSLQWPYKITQLQINALADGFSGQISETTVTPCTDDVKSSCLQKFLVSLTMLPDFVRCTFNGDYSLLSFFSCRGDPDSCPSKNFPPQSGINFTLTSQNICTGVNIDINLLGSISSFGDAGRTTSKTAFLSGDISYYTVAVQSTAALNEVKIVRVSFREFGKQNSSIYLYDTLQGGGPTTLGTNLGLTTTAGTSSAQMQFLVLSNARTVPFNQNLYLINSNSYQLFSMELTIVAEVKYPTSFGAKRGPKDSTEQIQIVSQIFIDLSNTISSPTSPSGQDPPKTQNSTSTTLSPSFSSLCLFVFVFFLYL